MTNKNTNTTAKNKITIFEGCGESKQKYELFNFSKVDHYYNKETGIAYIRVLCGSSFYYFRAMETSIAEIEIF